MPYSATGNKFGVLYNVFSVDKKLIFKKALNYSALNIGQSKKYLGLVTSLSYRVSTTQSCQISYASDMTCI